MKKSELLALEIKKSEALHDELRSRTAELARIKRAMRLVLPALGDVSRAGEQAAELIKATLEQR